MANEQVIGQLVIKLATSTVELTGGLKKAQEAVGSFVSSVASGMAKIAGAASLAVVANQIKSAVTEATSWAGEMDKMALKTGMTTEALSRLVEAADDVGVGGETVQQAMKFLNKSMGEAKDGAGAFRQDFEALGIAYADTVTGKLRPSGDVFLDLSDAVQKFGTSGEVLNVMMRLMGRGFQEIVPLAEKGSVWIRQAGESADKAGLLIRDGIGKQSRQFAFDLNEVGDNLRGFTRTIVYTFLPSLLDGSRRLLELAVSMNSLKEYIVPAAEAIKVFAIAGVAAAAVKILLLSDAFVGLAFAVRNAGFVIEYFATTTLIGMLKSPLMWAVLGVGLLAAQLAKLKSEQAAAAEQAKTLAESYASGGLEAARRNIDELANTIVTLRQKQEAYGVAADAIQRTKPFYSFLQDYKDAIKGYTETKEAADQYQKILDLLIGKEKQLAVAADKKDLPARIDPAVLAARHKANLRISQIAMAEELVVLEESYKQGAIDLEAYYERRKVIVARKIQEEVALLKKEAGAKETKPERKEEIRAEVFALESAGRTEIIKVTREQAEAYKKLWAAIDEGDLAGFVARNNLLMADLQNQFADGLVSTRDFFDERRKIIEENAQAAITNVEDQITPGMDPVAAEAAQNKIKSIRAQLAADLKQVDRDEVLQVRANEEEKWRIRQAFAQLKVDATRGGTSTKVQARYDAELAAAEAAHAQELASYQKMTDAELEAATGFHDRTAALASIRQEQAAAIGVLQEEQARKRFDDLMSEAAAYGNVQMAIETLMGAEGQRAAVLQEQQSYIQLYKQAWIDANLAVANSMQSLYSGMTSWISSSLQGLIEGTMRAQDVLKGLGKMMLQIITEYVAKWIVSRLFMLGMEMLFAAGVVKIATGAAAAVATAWAPAAFAASVATLGGAVVEGSAALALGLAAAVALFSGMQGTLGGGMSDAVNGGTGAMFAEGGPVTSGSGTEDDVPALLTRGEYVIPRNAVDFYGGPSIMEKIRRMIIPRDRLQGFGFFPVSRPQFAFAGGGMVSGGGSSSGDVVTSPSRSDSRADKELTVNLYVDGKMIGGVVKQQIRTGQLNLKLA